MGGLFGGLKQIGQPGGVTIHDAIAIGPQSLGLFFVAFLCCFRNRQCRFSERTRIFGQSPVEVDDATGRRGTRTHRAGFHPYADALKTKSPPLSLPGSYPWPQARPKRIE
jgi:hypothetical protein